ncbi:MAG: AsmA family protein [Candidatus Omnitrophica bacterium]|nr:AsmA family protein [Candidatus Omnitrophota bacterium]MCM8791486.1 AsmA family protein [Candidatus Omnitrophota bacterium]
MTKKLLVVFVWLVLVIVGALAYLVYIALPASTANLVVMEIEKATGKKVLLQDLRYNIAKGLVLQDLVIYDKSSITIWAKNVSCGIELAPLFAKKIVIHSVFVDSPAIYVERRSDGKFNVASFFNISYRPAGNIALLPRRLMVRNGRVLFVDRTLDPTFKERLDNLRMKIHVNEDQILRYSLACDIPIERPIYFKSSGTYSIKEGLLNATVSINDVLLEEFSQYYSSMGFSFPDGYVDLFISLRTEEGCLNTDISGRALRLSVVKDTLRAKLDAGIKVMMRYDFADKSLEYAGNLKITDMDIEGITMLGKLTNLKANVEFDDTRIHSEDIYVEAYGMPWKARINVVNFQKPILDIYATSETLLGPLQKTLLADFGVKLPLDLAGKAALSVSVQMAKEKEPRLNGYIVLRDATIAFGSGNFPIEELNGEIQFTTEGLKWKDLKLRYRDVRYMVSGKVENFRIPKVTLEASSRDLSLESIFTMTDKVMNIEKVKGRWLNSGFNLKGELDFSEKDVIDADLNGSAELELRDLKTIGRKAAGIVKMKPAGNMVTDFKLSGDIKDLRSCNISARLKSRRISLYGLVFTDASAEYLQEEGAGYINKMRASLYGGTIEATAKMDFYAKGLPYDLRVDAREVKIDELRSDIGIRDKDVSGTLRVYLDLKGVFKDVSRLTGLGRAALKDGRLWQLNLFHGFGSIIFTKDFKNIVFTEGTCDFKIRDRTIFADYFAMKSDLINMYGSGTIGFDGSVNAVLKTELTEEAMYPSAQKNIADAIGQYTYTEVTGTLNNPRFKMKQSVPDIVIGVAGALLGPKE